MDGIEPSSGTRTNVRFRVVCFDTSGHPQTTRGLSLGSFHVHGGVCLRDTRPVGKPRLSQCLYRDGVRSSIEIPTSLQNCVGRMHEVCVPRQGCSVAPSVHRVCGGVGPSFPIHHCATNPSWRCTIGITYHCLGPRFDSYISSVPHDLDFGKSPVGFSVQ